MRILATGTTGTIGSHLGSEVEAIKLDLHSKLLHNDYPRFRKGDSIIHLAGVVGEEKVRRDVKYAYEVNVAATCRLAKRFHNDSDGKFLYVSSAHVYRNKNERLKEDDLVDPQSLYSKQKYEAENELREIFRKNPNQLLIVRLFSVLDWNLGEATLSGAIGRLINSDVESKLKNGDDIRDFLTPKTISQALLNLVRMNSTIQLVNLCSGIGTSIKEATRRMLDLKNISIHQVQIASGNSDSPMIVGDPSLIENLLRRKLEWRPTNK